MKKLSMRRRRLIVELLERRLLLTTHAVTLADVDFLGASAAGISGNASSFSADSQLIAFESDAGNLTANDFNGSQDIFVRDVVTGFTKLVSVSLDGVSASGPSFNPILSADGRFVLFESEANNLVPGDNNGAIRDVFVRDLLLETTMLVSMNTTGGSGNNHSGVEFISNDGHLVGFRSSASNLVAMPTNNQQNIYVRDLVAGTTLLVSVNFNNTAGGNSTTGGVNRAALSSDSRFVAFQSIATDLVTNDSNGIFADVFLRDLQLNTTSLVSINVAGTGSGNHQSIAPLFDPSGRHIAFVSKARDLVPGNPFADQVYLRDTLLNSTTLVSVDNAFDGAIPFQSTTPYLAFSPDGRYLAYEGPITSVNTQIYARDLIGHSTLLISANRFSDQTADHISDGKSLHPVFSPDGNTVYFASTATILLDENTNNVSQIYARDLTTKSTTLLSRQLDATAGDGASTVPMLSSGGQLLTFESQSNDLVANDSNRLKDSFVLDIGTTAIGLISSRDPSLVPEYTSRTTTTDQRQPTGMSSDGRFVVFNSDAQDLVTNTVGGRNAYRYDRQTRTNELVSVNPDGTGSTAGSGVNGSTVISANGRFVLFGSQNLNPVPGLQYAAGLPGGPRALFVRDMELGTTRVINRNAAGDVAGLVGEAFALSPSGRYAAFATNRSLLAQDTNLHRDVYVFDLQTDTLHLVSVNEDGNGGNNDSSILGATAVGEPHNIFSDDGRFLVFSSQATDLVDGVGSINNAIYLRDLESETTTLVSVTDDGMPATAVAESISADGSRVAFTTTVQLKSADTNSQFDIYVRDLATSSTILVSGSQPAGGFAPGISRDGQSVLYTAAFTGTSLLHYDLENETTTTIRTGTDPNYFARLSANGQFVSFLTTAADLAPHDTNNASDAFLYDVQAQSTMLLSINQAGTATGNRGVPQVTPLINEFGSLVAFSSDSFDLVVGDVNGRRDVFTVSRPTGGGSLRGEVFADNDGSGDRNNDEGFLVGWQVFLDENGDSMYQADETQVLTAADGRFAFNDLEPDDYTIVAELRDGFLQTAPLTMRHNVSIVADEIINNLDFGFQQQFVDLTVASVDLPLSAIQGETVTIDWFVANNGVIDAVGSWQDGVYLSRDTLLDTDDILLGTASHVGGLAIGDNYQGSLSVTMPAVLPGSYFALVQTDRRHQVPQSNRADDILSSTTTIDLDVPELIEDVDIAGTLHAESERQYFKITPPGDRSLSIMLDSLATSGATSVYIKRGALPTPGDFDFRGQAFEPDAQLLVPRTVRDSTYYILVEGQFGDAATAGFTLSAHLPGMMIANISPNRGGNTGRVTVRVDGTGLTPNTTVQLFQDPTTFDAIEIDFRDPSLLYATFDLNGAPTGSYSLFVFDGPANDLVLDLFDVVPAVENPLTITLTGPSNFRPGRHTPFFVEVTNTGNTDAIAPVLRVSSDQATFRLSQQTGDGQSTLTFLAASANGPAGVLRPGQTSRMVISFLSNLNEGGAAAITLERPSNLDETINWDGFKESSRPAFVSTDAWNILYERFTAAAGSTVGEYHGLLAANASYLSNLDDLTFNATSLADFVLQQVDTAMLGPALTSQRDLDSDLQELSLDFARVHLQSLAGRYRLGPLGYSWVHNWENRIAIDSDGNVAIERGGFVHYFTRQPNGSFQGEAGEVGTLTLQGDIYHLREPHGTTTTFRDDGNFETIEDSNGNRISGEYDSSSRLSILSHSNGSVLNFTYDPTNGRLARVTRSDGRTAQYQYNVDGTQLVNVTTDQGTLAYEYTTNSDPAALNALVTNTEIDGTKTFYSYDNQGRLLTRQREGADLVTMSYGPRAKVTFTDSSGAVTAAWFNAAGQPEVIVDAQENRIAYDYDARNYLTEISAADGSSSSLDFSGEGNLISSVNPLGGRLNLAYEPVYQQLASFQDANGTRTAYAIDAAGNLISEHYEDGTSKEFTYDSQGNVVTATSRRGDIIRYEYDDIGRVLSIDAAGIDSKAYSYDAFGNLLTATDAGGTTTLAYDSAGRLTRIDNPNGRFLTYNYDTAGRVNRVDQNGFVVNYFYDALGRLSELTDANATMLARYSYDVTGNVTSKELGNGTSTTYEYNSLGQLTSLVNWAPDSTVNSHFDYTYDAVGRRTGVTTSEGTTTFAYDLQGQLIKVNLPSGRSITYRYDANGNRVKVTDDGVETFYTSNEQNEYTNVGEATFYYDASGNLSTRADAAGTTTYTFNSQDQLVSVNGPAGTFSYEYDVFGNRTVEVANGRRREFLISPLNAGTVVGEFDADGGVVANYAFGLGLVGQFDETNHYYYDFDALGSATGLTDGSGEYVNRYSYLPFGETTVIDESVGNPFRFVGQLGVVDRGHGLLDMRLRHYDPSVGQFVSNDPLELASDDSNFRRYVGNDPVSFVDPLGLAGFLAVGKFDNSPLNPLDIALWDANVCVGHSEFIFESDGTHTGFTRPSGSPLFGAPGGFAPVDHANYQLLWKFEDEARLRRAIETIDRSGDKTYNLIPGFGAENCHSIAKQAFFEYYVSILRDPFTIIIPAVLARDPNDIVGPAGFGEENFTTSGHVFPYTIRFENDPEQATAPAQEVFVTQQLDSDLDWSTFELGDIGFGSFTIDVPDGLKEYQTRVEYQNQDGSPLLVDASGRLDLVSGLVTWTFRSLDPNTGELPNGAFDGFLPVNDASGRGDGFINYLVYPKTGLATGTPIDAQASIVFDINAPLETNTFVNTIDDGPPTSRVTDLPQVTSSTLFTVSWSGSDDTSGSGIASYDVFVSTDGGPFEPFVLQTSETSAEFSGVVGHSYGFTTVARDNVGNVETTRTQADTQTVIDVVSSGPKLHTGIVNVRTSVWTTVSLPSSYTDMVVVTTPVTDRTNASVTTRIRNVSGNSFEIMLQHAGTLGGLGSVTLPVHFTVVEAGAYTLAEHGVQLEAIKYLSTVTDRKNSYVGENQTPILVNSYSQPVVVGQVMSFNDPQWSAFWSRGGSEKTPISSANVWVGKHVGSDQMTSRADEVIGYIIIEQGDGRIGAGSGNAYSYHAMLGGYAIDGVFNNGASYPNPIAGTTSAVASVSGFTGPDGGWAVLHGDMPLTSAINLAVEEDQAQDVERGHNNEHVAYIVFRQDLSNNTPPSAQSQSVGTDEDFVLPIMLAGNDPENDPLSFLIVTPPSHGTLAGTGANLSYTPELNFNGNDSFTFKVNDGQLDSNIVSVSIDVIPVNDPPTADLQAVRTSTDTDASIILSGADVDEDSLTFMVVDQPSFGKLVGTVPNLTYMPPSGFVGEDSFTFKTNDGTVDSPLATVTIDVTAASIGPKLQTGIVEVATGAWTTVTLEESYTEMVVVTTLNTDKTNASVATRVRVINDHTFEVMLQRTGTLGDTDPRPLPVHFVVAEAGVYNAAEHGVNMEVVKFSSSITDYKNSFVGQDQTGLLTHSYNNPVVVGQVMSFNDPDWSTFWTRGTTSFDPVSDSAIWVGKQVGSDPDTTREPEDLGFIVMDAGTGSIGNVGFSAQLGASQIDGVFNLGSSYPLSLSNPTSAVASPSGMHGPDGGWAVLYGKDPLIGGISLAIEEDQTQDLERGHANEHVAYILFAPLTMFSGLPLLSEPAPVQRVLQSTTVSLNIDGTQLADAAGNNTLMFTGDAGEIDLSNPAAVVLGFNRIDLSGEPSNSLTLDAAAVARLSAVTKSIDVVVGEGDWLHVRDAANWRMIDPVIVNGKFVLVAKNLLGGETMLAELTDVWRNFLLAGDINNSGDITAGDALEIVYELNQRLYSDPATGSLRDPQSVMHWPGMYLDRSGDDAVTALDALMVINDLYQQTFSAKSESSPLFSKANASESGNSVQAETLFSSIVPDSSKSRDTAGSTAGVNVIRRLVEAIAVDEKPSSELDTVDALLADEEFVTALLSY